MMHFTAAKQCTPERCELSMHRSQTQQGTRSPVLCCARALPQGCLPVSAPEVPPLPICKVPPLMVIPPGKVFSPVSVNWPALMVVVPLKLLLFDRVTVPAPLLVRAPVPLMAPA